MHNFHDSDCVCVCLCVRVCMLGGGCTQKVEGGGTDGGNSICMHLCVFKKSPMHAVQAT